MDLINVGYIGLGNIGKPSAQRLITDPYRVHVYDLYQPSVDELAEKGAVPCSSVAELASKCVLDSVIAAVCEKLIRRHPHVFSDASLLTDDEIKANWENEKAKERELKNQQTHLSILADIPKNLPALSQAAKIQKRCSHVGFDWDNVDDVFAKIQEEVIEVEEVLHDHPKELAEELGDLMFAVVNLCRHAKQDPEKLLRAANKKFTRRFEGVETQVINAKKSFEEHDLAMLEQYWQQVKNNEKS